MISQKITNFLFPCERKVPITPPSPPKQHLDLCPSRNSINVHKNIQGKSQLIIIGGY